MADVTIAQVTTTVTSGDGVFDVLMRAVDAHLDKQYTSGRIKGADYATVYLGALQMVLQQAIAFTMQKQQVTREDSIATETIAASQANTLIKQQEGDAREALLLRQTTGYDEDYKTKVFNTLMGLRTTGMTQEIAGLINGTSTGANALANTMLTDAGFTGVSNIIADV